MTDGKGKVTLDRDVFKALASDTRLDILKLLDERNMTASEIARQLDLHKATVHEHLEKLQDVGLVQRIEDDRKWVYHQLTWKGRRLLHPERITFAILLSSTVASLVTGLAALWLYLARPIQEAAQDAGSAADVAEGAPLRAADEAAGGEPLIMWVALGLLLLTFLLTVGTGWAYRRVLRAQGAAARGA